MRSLGAILVYEIAAWAMLGAVMWVWQIKEALLPRIGVVVKYGADLILDALILNIEYFLLVSVLVFSFGGNSAFRTVSRRLKINVLLVQE